MIVPTVLLLAQQQAPHFEFVGDVLKTLFVIACIVGFVTLISGAMNGAFRPPAPPPQFTPLLPTQPDTNLVHPLQQPVQPAEPMAPNMAPSPSHATVNIVTKEMHVHIHLGDEARSARSIPNRFHFPS